MFHGRIKCPWHGACFSTSTGDIEDLAGLDSIPVFETKVINESVYVISSPEQLNLTKRPFCNVKSNAENQKVFVIIGGGYAGAAAAEEMRHQGFTGKILIFSKEKNLPIDTPKLSKVFGSEPEKLQLRSENFYKENDIEMHLETIVGF